MNALSPGMDQEHVFSVEYKVQMMAGLPFWSAEAVTEYKAAELDKLLYSAPLQEIRRAHRALLRRIGLSGYVASAHTRKNTRIRSSSSKIAWREAPVDDDLAVERNGTKQILPRRVRDVMERILMMFPKARFWVESLGTDPILRVQIDQGGSRHILFPLVWEEKDGEVVIIQPPA